MSKRHQALLRIGLLVLLLLASATPWTAPSPALAQSLTCPLEQPQNTSSTSASSSSQPSLPANLRLTPHQKQALCQAADALERQSLGLTADLTSALVPGTLGPVGLLSVTDVAAHTYSPEAGAQFDVAVAATTAGLTGSILLNTGLIGHLRALAHDVPDPNYTAMAQPVIPPFVFPSPGRDTNVAVASSFHALLVNEAQAMGVAQGLLHSLRRAQGAAAAGNVVFQTQHLRAAGLYAAQLATLLSRETHLRLNVQGAYLTENLPVSLGDPGLVAALTTASQALVQFALTQGVALPVPAPPLPPNVPVALPSPPPAPAAP